MMPLWVSLILFQIGWFTLVIGSASQLYWLALPLFPLFAYLQQRHLKLNVSDYLRLLVVAITGILVDQLFSWAGFIQFSTDSQWLPAWLLLLWFWFALTFPSCYGWLQGRPLLASIFGGLFAPVAYWASTQLANVNILQPLAFTLFCGLFWALLFGYLSGVRRGRDFAQVSAVSKSSAH